MSRSWSVYTAAAWNCPRSVSELDVASAAARGPVFKSFRCPGEVVS